MPRLFAALLLSAWATALHAQTQEPECLAVESAFAENRIDDLASISLEEPRWQALQQFRLAAAYIPTDERKQAREAVRRGLDIVNSALETTPDDVAMLLLGAMLDGQYLLLDRWRFLHNGLRGMARLRKAESQEPSNPRAAMIRGTAKVVLPALLGGDAKEAISLFEETLAAHGADELPFAETPLCVAGQWAQVDLLNWLGRAYSKTGDKVAAQRAYQQALARSPGNHWVRLAVSGEGYDWVESP